MVSYVTCEDETQKAEINKKLDEAGVAEVEFAASGTSDDGCFYVKSDGKIVVVNAPDGISEYYGEIIIDGEKKRSTASRRTHLTAAPRWNTFRCPRRLRPSAFRRSRTVPRSPACCSGARTA